MGGGRARALPCRTQLMYWLGSQAYSEASISSLKVIKLQGCRTDVSFCCRKSKRNLKISPFYSRTNRFPIGTNLKMGFLNHSLNSLPHGKKQNRRKTLPHSATKVVRVLVIYPVHCPDHVELRNSLLFSVPLPWKALLFSVSLPWSSLLFSVPLPWKSLLFSVPLPWSSVFSTL